MRSNFDTVCQSKLIEVLSRTIKDGRVISLIHKYLNAGVIANGMCERTEIGMPQGKLFLKVNREKTEVAPISKVKYLGYTFYRFKGKCRFRVHQKSVAKMKNKIRELTDRNNGMSNAKREEKYQQFVRGWVNYFKLADMKKILKETDEWARRRIRAVYWKQWKKIKTKYRMLKALGLEHWKAKELACSRKGYWRMAHVLNSGITNKIIAKLGYTSMLDYYLVVYEN